MRTAASPNKVVWQAVWETTHWLVPLVVCSVALFVWGGVFLVFLGSRGRSFGREDAIVSVVAIHVLCASMSVLMTSEEVFIKGLRRRWNFSFIRGYTTLPLVLFI